MDLGPEIEQLLGVVSTLCADALQTLNEAAAHVRRHGRHLDAAIRADAGESLHIIAATTASRPGPPVSESFLSEGDRLMAAADCLRRAASSLPQYDPHGWCPIDARLSSRMGSLASDIRQAAWRWMTVTVVHDADAKGARPPVFEPELLGLAQRVHDACSRKDSLPPPATAAQVAATEVLLGFTLPDALRCMYLQVANGGFGPGLGGVVGAIGGRRNGNSVVGGFRDDQGRWQWQPAKWEELDIVDAYRQRLAWSHRSDPKEAFGDEIQRGDPLWFEPFDDPWPTGMLMLTEHGCAHWSFIDATSGQIRFCGPDLDGMFGDRPLDAVPFAEYLQVESRSLEEWLESWLAGKDNQWGYGNIKHF